MKTTFLLLLLAAQTLMAQTRSAPDAHADFFPIRQGLAGLSSPHEDVLQDGPSAERKSIGLAAVYSLLLPGMGELYVDNTVQESISRLPKGRSGWGSPG